VSTTSNKSLAAEGQTLDAVVRRLCSGPQLRRLLDAGVAPERKPVAFGGIADAARPFVCSRMVREVEGSLWVVAPDVRRQEDFATELLAWFPDVLSLPDLEFATSAGALPDPETLSERMDAARRIAAGEEKLIIVLTESQLDEKVQTPDEFRKTGIRLKTGAVRDRDELVGQFREAGFEELPKIFARGQFSVRGGIVDVFPWDRASPIRLEFFGDEIDSIREFNIDEQTSIRRLDGCELLLGRPDDGHTPIRELIRPGDLLIGAEGEVDGADLFFDDDLETAPILAPSGMEASGAGDYIIEAERKRQALRRIAGWVGEGWTLAVFSNNEGEAERLREVLREEGIPDAAIAFPIGSASRGFVSTEARAAVLTDAEIFGRSASLRARRFHLRREQQRAQRNTSDYSDYEEGDLVVHVEQGIGRYLGMRKIPGDAAQTDVLAVEYANEALLFVPLDQAWKLSRYVGVGKRSPRLSELGDGKWDRSKQKALRSIREYAGEMLRLHAERETAEGHAFATDGEWQLEFERSFLFKETDDQLRSVDEIKQDMESVQPMDRLLCGDVGFGKTEVAIRAAFKAVMDGKQVAVLTPTTVLAQQHYETFCERMREYPARIELLSRYRTRKQQDDSLKRLATGEADIVIGTHRLLSADVAFKDLGLVVVDEEQRFGVKHKEKLKARFRLVDVLTLSATPIPRTLYMALMGTRDMSLIETPPANRLPVETVVAPYDERIIRDAINRELHRGGQVYFLHNRVATIENVCAKIRKLCPTAVVDFGHGQMSESELEDVMHRFVSGKTDVLVATTIIESGLDIPNANTIVIDRADRFGLADLYQLRGRVGRSQNKAFAYLMLPRDLLTVSEARKRVSAIRQYSELGAGFRIAMRDLEIRGAGNILGTAQSGHIISIGFDLYCRMLRRAVQELRGEERSVLREVLLRIDFVENREGEPISQDATPAFIPSNYIADPAQRIEAYRKLAEASDDRTLDELEQSWRDRYGPVPPPAEHAILVGRIRCAAVKRRVDVVETQGEKLMLQRGGDYILVGARFPRLTRKIGKPRLREVFAYLRKLD